MNENCLQMLNMNNNKQEVYPLKWVQQGRAKSSLLNYRDELENGNFARDIFSREWIAQALIRLR